MLFEYACHEGNYGMEGILSGARAEEAEEMTAKILAMAGAGVRRGACSPRAFRLHAHHAFAAEFDAEQADQLRGTVRRVEWINPHTWIHIDVKETAARRSSG